MLAYVFWHWPKRESEAAAYEERLSGFHRALAADAPDGMISSAAFRASGASWIPGSRAYEDWYLLTDFDALGNLNEAAVSGGRATPHDDIAAHAAGGTAGIYRSVAGNGRLAPVRFAAWIAKPEGMRYPEFFALLAGSSSAPDVTLWQRQLTLGPGREFCLHAREQHALATELDPLWVELSPVWLPG